MRQVNFLISILIFSLISCSPKYISYKKALNKFRRGEISREDIGKKYYYFYKERKFYNPADTTLPVRFDGCYVNVRGDGIVVYKFTPTGEIIESAKFYQYPKSSELKENISGHYYYKIVGTLIEVEYLSTRDWKVRNIVLRGKINADTIVFSQRDYLYPLRPTPDKIYERYVFDKKLNFIPD